jgi:hypothetical protein
MKNIQTFGEMNRRRLLQEASAAIAAPLLLGGVSAAEVGNHSFTTQGLNGCQLLPGAQFYVGIDNKGLWPNLTKLPNGEIAAAIYNHPSHGYGDNSDVELWISKDGGINWTFRSKLSSHAEEPQGIRMNHAVGLNADDHLVALVSGYRKGQKLPMLKLQRCISKDHGKTWDRQLLGIDIVPHGDIFKLPNGHLVCPAYRKLDDRPGHFRASVIFSNDGGKTWGNEQVTVDDVNESHLIRRLDGTWLAVGRTKCRDRMDSALPHGSGEIFIKSTDEGKTWSEPKLISPQGQENAHILELKDGRLLCSFTSRIPGLFGVVMRMSSDGGATWSLPVVLISTPARDWHKTDCGYPSSIQLEDGSIVTAYYFGPKRPEWAAYGLPWHQRYHMGIAKWDLSVWPDSAPMKKRNQ